MRYKVNVRLGKKIKKFRKELKMTQEELAEKVKLHYTSLSRIERGETNPPVQTVRRIAQALKKSLKDLFE